MVGAEEAEQVEEAEPEEMAGTQAPGAMEVMAVWVVVAGLVVQVEPSMCWPLPMIFSSAFACPHPVVMQGLLALLEAEEMAAIPEAARCSMPNGVLNIMFGYAATLESPSRCPR